MPVAVLARVSTEEQAEKMTIEIQTEFARKYADLHGLKIAGIYADDGISGVIPLGERPEGKKLLADARLKQFETVLVYKLDRLGRACRVILNAVDELEQHGIKVASMTEPFDTGNPFGRFVLTILAAVAEFERENILERTKGGRMRLLHSGGWPGGPSPIGYDVVAGRLALSTEPMHGFQQPAGYYIRWAFHHLAFERGSLVTACRHLNALGIPTRLPPNGHISKWSPPRLHAVLTNPLYHGLFRYKAKSGEGTIEIECPPLVSLETWLRCQQRLAENRTFSSRNSKREYLLTGLIICECGAHYCGRAPNKKHSVRRAYTCNRRQMQRQGYAENLPGCDNPQIGADGLEKYVWELVERYLDHPGEVLEQLDAARTQQGSDIEGLLSERSQLEASLANADEERKRVMLLYRRSLIGERDVEDQFAEIAGNITALQDQLDAIIERLHGADAYREELSGVERLLRELADVGPRDDFATRKWLCRALIRSIRIYRDAEGVQRAQIIAKFEPQGAIGSGRYLPSRNNFTLERLLSVA